MKVRVTAAIHLKGLIRMPKGPEIGRETLTVSRSFHLSHYFFITPQLPPSSIDVFPLRLTKGSLCEVITAVK